LGIARGTGVVDERNHRSLGYWTGSGLSPDLPPKEKPSSDTAQSQTLNASDQLALLESEPETERGLAGATWVLLNTPDGPDVEKAGKAVLEHHLKSTNVLGLVSPLEGLRHRCSKPILEGLLAQNPDAGIRAASCFSLGVTLKDESKFGVNKNSYRPGASLLSTHPE
jgi:hypothetical protein